MKNFYFAESFQSKEPIVYKNLVNENEGFRKFLPNDQRHLNIKLSVKKIKNAFVSHYGLVIKNNLLVGGCAPSLKIGYDKNFYFQHWRKAIEEKYVCKYGKSLKSVTLDENTEYLLIFSPWFSYYFWITESIPRLLMMKDSLKDLVLIYPSSFDRFPFVKAVLDLFPELKIQRIESDSHMFIPNLIMPEVKPWTILFIPEQINSVRNFLIPKSSSCLKSNLHFERICITRQGTHRSFENFDAVNNLLIKYGFITVKMEEYSIFEQIQIMQHAKCALGISGAGHTNIHFMKTGSRFLDITAYNNIPSKKYKFHFYKLACIIGVDYLIQYAENVEKEGVPFYNQNLLIDLELFEQNLNLLIKN